MDERYYLTIVLVGLLAALLAINVGKVDDSSIGLSESQKALQNISSPENIVLIVLEGTRADHIGPCYGYSRSTAPNLCEFADDAVQFDNAYSQGTFTTISFSSLLTGRYPNEVFDGDSIRLSTKAVTIPELLSPRYNTAIELEKRLLSFFNNSNFYQGFDRVKPVWRYNTTPDTNTAFEESLNQPFFFTKFYRSPLHAPYSPSNEFRNWDSVPDRYAPRDSIRPENFSLFDRNQTLDSPSDIETRDEISDQDLIDLYDGALLQVDTEIDAHLQFLEQNDMYKDSLIIVTSDHGELLGKKGYLHASKPWNKLIHVPLILKLPGNKLAGSRIRSPVSLMDIMPTIHNLAGSETEVEYRGQSLLETIADQEQNEPVVATNDDVWTIINGTMKYMQEDLRRYCLYGYEPWGYGLYNISQDPYETTDIALEHPSLIKQMRQRLCEAVRAGERSSIETETNQTDWRNWPYN